MSNNPKIVRVNSMYWFLFGPTTSDLHEPMSCIRSLSSVEHADFGEVDDNQNLVVVLNSREMRSQDRQNHELAYALEQIWLALSDFNLAEGTMPPAITGDPHEMLQP